jgi:para-nitrobenzyl esterase
MLPRLLTTGLLLLLCSQAFPQLALQIATADGLVQGERSASGEVAVFRGLPYAAAPVGANRWREPQPVAQWSGVREATRFAPRCIQGGFAPGADQPLTSEDCLYLNIWTPAERADQLLPVIVWIHGGGFFTGAGSADIYDGENLASKGAVVLTFNYRLGSFGFLAHPELTAESPNHSSGNYAMLDMVAVLEWVYENIASFGGDPINITIVGESAGAQAVGTLMASPLSAGLFHRAVLQSGGWMGLSIDRQATLAQREALGSEQVAAFGASSIAALRQASAQQIFEHFPNSGGINVDGWFLPQDTSLTVAAGAQHPMDVLVGSNRDEAIFFGPGPQDVASFRTYASDKFGPLAERFLTIYPAGSDTEANQSYQQAFNDELAWQMRHLAQQQAERGFNAWVYFFTRVPPGQEARGATHVAELPYMFNQHEQNQNWTDTDRSLGNLMSAYWVNFAARGNPNGQGMPAWPSFRNNTLGSVQILGDSVEAESSQVPTPEVLEFFDAAYQQHLDSL